MPTQLGRLERMADFFWLASNKLCSDMPTELQALTSNMYYWGITTGNSIGTVRNFNTGLLNVP